MVQKHYYYFGKRLQDRMNGEALNKENWDILRTDEEEGPFSIEKTVEAYEKNCKKQSDYRILSQTILDNIDKQKKILSLGIGKGVLEWHIKDIDNDVYVACADYAENSINQLRNVFLRL